MGVFVVLLKSLPDFVGLAYPRKEGALELLNWFSTGLNYFDSTNFDTRSDVRSDANWSGFKQSRKNDS
jgi:hypothetical protein